MKFPLFRATAPPVNANVMRQGAVIHDSIADRFFVCNFSEYFEEHSIKLHRFIGLTDHWQFGCGRRPR
jgi:hypothetical protein